MQMQINAGQNEEMEGRVVRFFFLLQKKHADQTPVQEQRQSRMNLEGFVHFTLTY